MKPTVSFKEKYAIKQLYANHPVSTIDLCKHPFLGKTEKSNTALQCVVFE